MTRTFTKLILQDDVLYRFVVRLHPGGRTTSCELVTYEARDGIRQQQTGRARRGKDSAAALLCGGYVEEAAL